MDIALIPTSMSVSILGTKSDGFVISMGGDLSALTGFPVISSTKIKIHFFRYDEFLNFFFNNSEELFGIVLGDTLLFQ